MSQSSVDLKPDNKYRPSFSRIARYFKTHRVAMLKQLRVLLPYILIYVAMMFILNYFNISAESVRGYFGGFGWLLIPAFIGVQMISSFTPLPDLPFNAACVLFFEPWQSFLIIYTGMWLASLINFALARKLGRTYVIKKYPGTVEWMDKFAGRYGFETIIVARSFTFVTFDLVAYAAGISNITSIKFVAATTVSLLPVALNSTLVGLAITSGNISSTFLLVVFTSVIAVSLGWIARRYRLHLESKD